jgi:hypothetical protein
LKSYPFRGDVKTGWAGRIFMVGLLAMLLALFLQLSHPLPAVAASAGGKGGGALGDSLERDRANRPRRSDGHWNGEKEKAGERVRHFIGRTLDDLNGSLSLADDEIQQLEKETDAIAFLESPRREKDFTDLLGWYHDYTDWLRGEIGDLEDELALFSADPGQEWGHWHGRYEAMIEKQLELEGQLEKRIKRYDAEEKRLAGIIDRRRLLQERFNDLEYRLARIEERIRDFQGPAAERRDSERKAKKLRTDIRVVQNELVFLPLVDEDLLKHYAVLVERGEAELDWLALKRDEYEALRDAAAAVGLTPRRDAPVMEAAYRRLIRLAESGIKRLSRKSDELARKRSRGMPAGSLKEVERSRELADFYERLQGRYHDETRRLRLLIGAYEADLAGVLSERQ